MTSITFKHVTLGMTPLNEIGLVYNEAHKTKGLNEASPPDGFVKAKELKKMAQEKDIEFILAYQNITPTQQKLCGFTCLDKQDDGYNIVDICTITPKGSGVGATMVNLTFEKAVEQKKSYVSLTATDASKTFYENLFFEKEDVTDKGIRMTNKNVAETAEILKEVYGTPRI